MTFIAAGGQSRMEKNKPVEICNGCGPCTRNKKGWDSIPAQEDNPGKRIHFPFARIFLHNGGTFFENKKTRVQALECGIGKNHLYRDRDSSFVSAAKEGSLCRAKRMSC